MTLHFAAHYILPNGFSELVSSVLKVLSLAPDGALDESFDNDDTRVHKFRVHLRGDGMISGPPWQFTTTGLQSLACGVQLTELGKVCTRLQKDADLREATLLELLLEMDAAGFDRKELTRHDVKEAKTNPYTVGVSSKT